jgi:phage replication-related protein YjqB (UPF0714/DUF867 family)
LIIFIGFIGCVEIARADRHKDYFQCYTGCSLALEDSSECKKSENDIPGDYGTVGWKGRGDVVVLAIHGGAIELNTDEIARKISIDNNWDSYTFIGRIQNQTCKDLVPGSTRPNFDVLHITSEHFNDPVAIEAMRSHAKAVSIHGHRRDHASGSICVGGLNKAQRDEFISYVNSNRSSFSLYHLNPIDAPNQESGDCSEDSLRGVNPNNIVNKNLGARGLQLELNFQMRRDLVKIGADYEELRQIIYGAVVQAMKK